MARLTAHGQALKVDAFTSRAGDPWLSIRVLVEDDVIEGLCNPDEVLDGGKVPHKGEPVELDVEPQVRNGQLRYQVLRVKALATETGKTGPQGAVKSA